MANRVSRGKALLGALSVGGGTAARKVQYGTVAIDPPSIGAATTGNATATIAGVAPGDVVLMFPPSTLNAGLGHAGSYVSGANTVTVRLVNPTAGAIDDTSKTWEYLWLDLT